MTFSWSNAPALIAADNLVDSSTYGATLGWLPLTGAGIDPTGVADSTAAIQAKINASPFGATHVLAAGIYQISNLTLSGGRHLRGSGYAVKRDGLTTFGNAGYADASLFSGTVIRSTATTGTAITVIDTVFNQRSDLDGFVLVGPGSDTSVGIAVGDATHAVIDSIWPNVMVCNFATGVTLTFVEECQLGLIIRGCTTPLTLATATNNNTFTMLAVEQCAGSVTDDTSCTANVFDNPLFQGNTGTSIALSGVNEKIKGGYWENSAGTYAIDFVTGTGNSVTIPKLTTVNDGIRVQAAAYHTRIEGPQGLGLVANAGQGTLYLGLKSLLTDTSSNLVFIDPYGQDMQLPPTSSPLAVRAPGAGSAAIVSWGDAVAVPAWQLYKNNATGLLLLRDMINGYGTADFVPDTPANGGAANFHVPFGMFACTTGTRPPANYFNPGTAIYDTTLSKPIWTDATVWRDAAGTAV